MAEMEFKPKNQDSDPLYNREPGIVIVPGSNYAKEMEKFEQFPSQYGGSPGNPYTYRPFPKMMYRAEIYNGKACCMAAPPNVNEFSNPDEYRRAQESARQFTERCQRTVKTESEMNQAWENGWRESPADAVDYLEGREQERANATAERQYEDRNMSEPAKLEIKEFIDGIGGEHAPEIPEKPVRRRRTVKKAGAKKTMRRRKA